MEFKVTPDKASNLRHNQHIRLFLWGAVFLMVGAAVIGILGIGSLSQAAETALVVISVVIVVCVVVAAYVLGAQEGFERAKQDTTFLLTGNELIRQRTGWPEVRIGLSEVKSLYERRAWLLVESIEPHRRIAIPRSVEKFQFLRSELLKHGPLVKAPRQSSLVLLPTATSILCWLFVFRSAEPRIVKTAAFIALALFASGSFRIARLQIPSPKRYLVWAMLAGAWVAALWLIRSRLTHL